MVFLSSIAKTNESYLKLIFGAEYLFKTIKKGTHDWNKFINDSELSELLQKNGIKVI